MIARVPTLLRRDLFDPRSTGAPHALVRSYPAAERPPQHASTMTFAEQRQARAAQYRLLADAESALMHSCDLPLVRDKHELAAFRWSALAEVDELPRQGELSPA